MATTRRRPTSRPASARRWPTGRPNPDGPLEPFKAHYRGLPNSALFPFGHGLTYGEIGYAALALSGDRLAWDGTLTATATLTNRGERAAEEVAQLYVRDVAASITRPVRQLKGFRRVPLAPGASRQVSFTLGRHDLTFIGADLRPTVEPGAFQLWIAPSAEAEGVTGRFELLPG